MYLPGHFAETRPEVLHRLIADEPLGLLVTVSSTGPLANLIPFEFAPNDGASGTLRAHVARANPVWKDFNPAMPALVVFQGPSAYVSPNLYPSKSETHKVVPTYNYVVVQAKGPFIVRDDPRWVRAQVERLTKKFEGQREKPWAVSEAPADFIEKQVMAIVGIEIPVSELTGKWKVSQNRTLADRESVAKGLSGEAMGGIIGSYLDRTKPSA